MHSELSRKAGVGIACPSAIPQGKKAPRSPCEEAEVSCGGARPVQPAIRARPGWLVAAKVLCEKGGMQGSPEDPTAFHLQPALSHRAGSAVVEKL